MSNSDYITIENNDEFVNKVEIGDPNSILSDLQIKLNVPNFANLGDTLLVEVINPEGTTSVIHVLVKQDFDAGFVTLKMPNSNVSNNAEYIQGEYILKLHVFTSAGAVTSVDGFATFTLDTIAPEIPSVVLESDSGASSADLITSNGKLAVNKSEVNSTIQYSIDDGASWVDDQPVASEGTNVVLVREVDEAGNASEVNRIEFVLDTTAPQMDAQTLEYIENQEVDAVVAVVSSTDNLEVADHKFKHSDGALSSVSEDGFFEIDKLGNIQMTAAGVISELNDFSIGNNSSIYNVVVSDEAGNTTESEITLETKSSHVGVTTLILDDQTVTEGEAAVFDLTVINAARNAVVSLDFIDDSAISGEDFKKDTYQYSLNDGASWQNVPASEEITLTNAGDQHLLIRVDIVDDKKNEETEEFELSVSLLNPKTADAVVVSSTITIADNSVVANDDGNVASVVFTSENSSTQEKNITSTYAINESNSDVAGLEDGGYVVVWQGNDSNGFGIYSQKYGANGNKIDDAYLINTKQSGSQSEPYATDLGNGQYLVTWTDSSTNPSKIKGQLMDADNQFKIGDEFIVADAVAVRYDPIIGLEDGGFIVTWSSNVATSDDNSGFAVYGQRFDSSAQAIGSSFLINQTTTGNQQDSDVALVDGKLVVTWTGNDSNGTGIFSREFEINDDVKAIREDFENGSADGWSNGAVQDGGDDATSFLGSFGKGESSSKTYDFGSEYAGRDVEISFDFYEIDSWDYEQFIVFINGETVSNAKHYYYRTEVNSEKMAQIEGSGSWNDSKTAYTFKATLDAEGKITLGFGSTLNEAKTNESFGIDNISITTTSVSAIGDEERVNSTEIYAQDESSITHLTDGGYVISWTSQYQDSKSDGVFLQTFDSDGNKLGDEVLVNTIYTNTQDDSSITQLPDGGYVVTWTSYNQDGSYAGIYAQRFDSAGDKLGAEVSVNDSGYHNQYQPSIDTLEDGGYVISWTGYVKENSSYDIFTKRYNADGSEYRELITVEEKNVSHTYAINESNSDVAGLEDGGYVIVWQSNDSNGNGIYSQKYDANGNKVDDAYLVNTAQTGNQSEPYATDLGNGQYLVTWTDNSTNPTSIKGQLMDADNQFKIGDEFVIAESTVVRYDPIIGLEDGGFIVTWSSNVATSDDNSGFAVYGQRFDSSAQELGSRFLVNQTTTGNQQDSDVALVNGKLVVTWTSNDSNSSGIYSREFDILEDMKVISEDFENGTADGWSNGVVQDGGASATSFLGSFGKGESTSKTYDFGSEYAGKEVDISFDFYEIDSWDKEQFIVFINGEVISSAKHYYYTTEANSEKMDQIEGSGTWNDSKTAYTFKATLDAEGKVTLGFGSTLNEDKSNESFGIDNITIATSSVSAAGDEQLINTSEAYAQDESSITHLADGSYVVSWTSQYQDTSGDGVYLQKFDSDGNKVSGEVLINTVYASNQNDSSITQLPEGGYVVTWTSYNQDGSYAGVYAQRFDGAGDKLGAEVSVNDSGYHNQYEPSIDTLADGGYVIAWTGYDTDNASYDIFTKRYNSDGSEKVDVYSLTVEAGQELVIAVANLLQNDSDPQGDMFDIISVQGAEHGSVEIVTDANGVKSVVFTADDDYSGSASFTYTIEDEHGARDTASVNFSVYEANQQTTSGSGYNDNGVITLFDLDDDDQTVDILQNVDYVLAHVSDEDGIDYDKSYVTAKYGTVSLDPSTGNIIYHSKDDTLDDIVKLKLVDDNGDVVTRYINVAVNMAPIEIIATAVEEVEMTPIIIGEVNEVDISTPGSIVKTSSSGWNTTITSENTVDASHGVKLSFQAETTGKYSMWGLNVAGEANASSAYTVIDYAIYFNINTIQVRENGTSLGNFGAYQTNDVFSIEIDENSGAVTYFKNGEVFYTSKNTADLNADYNFTGTPYSSGAGITNLQFSSKFLSVNEILGDENQVIAILSAVDEDSSSWTYTLVDGEGDSANDGVIMGGSNGDELILKADYDTQANDVLSIRVKATDNHGNSYEEIIVINVIANPDIESIGESVDIVIDDDTKITDLDVVASNYTGQANSLIAKHEASTNYDDANPEFYQIGTGGDYILAWGSGYAGQHKGTFIQHFTEDGAIKGDVIQISSSYSSIPVIVPINDNGDYIVSWGQDSGNGYILNGYTQKFYSDGSFDPAISLGSMNQSTLDVEQVGDLTVYTWQNVNSVYAKVLNSEGTSVANLSLGGGSSPKVTLLEDGGYTLSWSTSTASSSVMLFDSNGDQIGDKQTIALKSESVYDIGNGQYVVAGNANNVMKIAVFDENNELLANSPLTVSSSSTTLNDFPSITSLSDDSGDFVVTWRSVDSGKWKIAIQHFHSDGSVAADLQTFDLAADGGGHVVPVITSVGTNGDYVIAWGGIEGTSYDIYTQKFDSDGSKIGEQLSFTGEDDSKNATGVVITSIGTEGAYSVAYHGYDNDGDISVYTALVNENGELAISYIEGDKGDFDITTPGLDDSAEYVQVTYSTGTLVVDGVLYASGSIIVAEQWDNVRLLSAEGAEFDLKVEAIDIDYSDSTPLILDLDDDGVETLASSAGVVFDIDGDGQVEQTGWVNSDDGLLVRDINNDGAINDATELFGEYTLKSDGSKAQDGFDALADLDSNDDGVFDKEDDAFAEVKIWRDENSDGTSQAHELLSLFDIGVESINLDSTAISENNEDNWSGLRSTWQDKDGETHAVDDVWFSYKEATDETIELADLLDTDDQLAIIDDEGTQSGQLVDQSEQIQDIDNTANNVVEDLLAQNTLID